MEDRFKSQLDALFEERDQRARNREDQSRQVADKRAALEARIEERFSTVVLPVLESVTKYLESKGMSANTAREHRGTIVTFEVGGSHIRILGRTEDMTVDTYATIKGTSGAAVTVPLDQR